MEKSMSWLIFLKNDGFLKSKNQNMLTVLTNFFEYSFKFQHSASKILSKNSWYKSLYSFINNITPFSLSRNTAELKYKFKNMFRYCSKRKNLNIPETKIRQKFVNKIIISDTIHKFTSCMYEYYRPILVNRFRPIFVNE